MLFLSDLTSQASPDYSFNTCVKTALARQVGCRPPWDIWSPGSIPVCTTVEEMAKHETLDWGHFNFEQKVVLNTTGCKIPCNYNEYKIEGEPQSGKKSMVSNE